MAQNRIRIDLPGISDELRSDIEERVTEFEAHHQDDVLADGPGWVPRIRPVDYAVAIAVNLVLVVWLIIALAGG